ncbi:MAG TPA: Dam family site-specific DNA-(adenine-N6)-methyltransferase [Draconibacterium sp.]|nr:Dam family site-specific DNA-(adenine-N6)-methyltransferase [Draconibacterium sp.]
MKKDNNYGTSEPIAKPFLKWAGGKGQLLNQFRDFYPAELKSGKISRFFEPFIGGGAVFFDVVQKYNIQSAYLYDINQELILTYRVIQQNVYQLIEILYSFQKKYEKLDDKTQSEFYYQTRAEFNQNLLKVNYSKYNDEWILRAAQIIFMNKTCFNGLFRLNQKGEFNVPAGRYKNPKILDEQNLVKVSKLLSIAEIKNAGFADVENDITDNAFVYFDPPYRPISKTSDFTSYSKYKFEDDEQRQLSDLFQRLNKRGIKQMLSNSDPRNNDPSDNFFDEIYKDYTISRIPALRMINSNAAKRFAINEIIVTNY